MKRFFISLKNRILSTKLSKWSDISCLNWKNQRLKEIVDFSGKKSKKDELLIMNNLSENTAILMKINSGN